MTACLLRLSAAEALTALAPLATSDRIRSSSSCVHGLQSLCMFESPSLNRADNGRDDTFVPIAEGMAKSGPSAGGRLGPVYLTTPGQGPVFPKNENDGGLFRTCRSAPEWGFTWLIV